MQDTSFAALYETWTTDRLLDVLDSTDEYEASALEAARVEIERRQLSDEQLAQAKADQANRRRIAAEKEDKTARSKAKLMAVGQSVFDVIDPVAAVEPSTQRYILLTTLFLGGLGLYQLVSQYDVLASFFFGLDEYWDLSMMVFVVLTLLPTVAALLFWLTKRVGWLIAAFYAMVGFSLASDSFIDGLFADSLAIDGIYLLEKTDPIVYGVIAAMYASLTWTLCLERIREVYGISGKVMQIMLGIVLGLSLVRIIFF